MDILTEIVAFTRTLVADRQVLAPLADLRARIAEAAPSRRLSSRLNGTQPHIIAEFKRKSPSRAAIDLNARPAERARQYAAGGAAAISVLTEPRFFGGGLEDLRAIRAAVDLPLLRKDFIIDAYQIYEARANGADLILLIARILTATEIAAFTALAHRLDMDVLCEIHEVAELDKIAATPIDLLGVNCRDLKHFGTSLERLAEVAAQLPPQLPWVAESGIHGARDVAFLQAAGYRLFLVGEHLMKSASPTHALRQLQAPGESLA